MRSSAVLTMQMVSVYCLRLVMLMAAVSHWLVYEGKHLHNQLLRESTTLGEAAILGGVCMFCCSSGARSAVRGGAAAQSITFL